MRFLKVLQNYCVIHDSSDTRVTWSCEDADGETDDKITLSWPEDNSSYLYFPLDAEIEFSPADRNMFTVKDLGGYPVRFEAYVPGLLVEPENDRSIDPTDVRIEISEPNRMWVKVGKFDVLLNHTGEGIVVDVWPWVQQDSLILPDEPVATCYAFDSDADEAIKEPE